MKIYKLIFLALGLTFTHTALHAHKTKNTSSEYNILTYGAKADGQTLNTQVIQTAIDAAAKAGGGKVIVPKGIFLTGSIIMKSNVNLHIEEDGVILGSTNPFDYKELNRWKALILGDNQQNVSITGKGTIDGQGRRLSLNIDSLFYTGQLDSTLYNFKRKRPYEIARPQNIELVKCTNILIQDISVINAACWVQTFEQCEKLTIDNIRVISDAYWNNDGMDISDCKDVKITNCFVDSADDGICLKSHTHGIWNDNILIENCTVRSSASAIKFGTASHGGFKNITIKNIKVHDTFRSAIALESVDGGELENVFIDGVEAVNTGNAIFIKLGNRNKSNEVGTLRNITIKNVKVKVPFGRPDINYELRGPALAFFHNPFPSSITGFPGHYVENITLENIEIIYPGKGNDGLAYSPISRLHLVPENESDYPEFSMFGELPAWGFYMRHVKGLTLKNITLKAEAKDYRPAYVFDDIVGLTMEEINIQEDDNGPQIILKDIEGPKLQIDNQLLKTVK